MATGFNDMDGIALPKEYVLHERYIIRKIIGAGGFGITYLAFDSVLDTNVAIKEYYPGYMVNRSTGDLTVSVFSMQRKQEFHHGLERFLQEARDVAKFNNQSGIVSVYDFFQENNTAYMVMEFLNGRTLQQFLQENPKVDEDFLFHLTFSVMAALEIVHNSGMIHRDISPDNIFICDDGCIKLLDFGAAKQAITSDLSTISVVLKHGYAPVEQYSKKGEIGPWTDIYAFGATLYRVVTGQIPENSLDRMLQDDLKDPIAYNNSISEVLNAAIKKALSLDKNNRFQTIDEMRAFILDGENHRNSTPVKNIGNAEPLLLDRENTNNPMTVSKKNRKKWIYIGVFTFAAIAIICVVLSRFKMHRGNTEVNNSSSEQEILSEEAFAKSDEKTTDITTESTTEHAEETSEQAPSTESNDYIFPREDDLMLLVLDTVLQVDQTTFCTISDNEYNTIEEHPDLVSQNPEVVAVDGSNITAKKAGNCLITCDYDGKTYAVYISVVDPDMDYPVTITTDIGTDNLVFSMDGEYSYEHQYWFTVTAEGDMPENVYMYNISLNTTTWEDSWIIGSWTEGEKNGDMYKIQFGSYPYHVSEDPNGYDYAFVLINQDNGEVLGLKKIHYVVK